MGSLRTDPIQTVFRKKNIETNMYEPTWVYCTRHGYFVVHYSAYYEPAYKACPLCTPKRDVY